MNMETLRRLRICCAFILPVILSSCGGGGNSASSTGYGAATDTSLPPVPSYQGTTAAVSVNTGNALTLSKDVIAAITNVNAIAQIESGQYFGFTNDQFPDTVSGPLGGSAVITGKFTSPGIGSVSVDFKSFQYSIDSADYTENGTVKFVYSAGGAGNADGYKVAIELYSVSVGPSATQYDVVNGTIDKTEIDNPGTPLVDDYHAVLTVKDSYSGDTFYCDPCDLNGNTVGGIYGGQQSGTVYFASVGKMSFKNTQPLSITLTPYNQQPFFVDGQFSFTGDGTTAGYFTGLNKYFASVGVDSNGDGEVDNAARIDWQTFGLDVSDGQGGDHPDANVWQQSEAYVGQPIDITGAYSHSPTGAYLSYAWKLVYAPPGSAATLTGATAPDVGFTPDLAGDYLLRLVVSDGTSQGEQDVVVHASAGTTPDNGNGYIFDVALGPDFAATAGRTVQMDARACAPVITNYAIDPCSGGTWTLTPPTGSSATLANTSSTTPTFVPDVNGVYTVTYTPVANFLAPAVQHVMVGVPFHLDAPVTLPNAYSNLVVADINGDTRPDIVASNGTQVEIFRQSSNRLLEAPEILDAPDQQDTGSCYTCFDQLAVGDLNADGLADIVVDTTTGADVSFQNPDGTFGTVTSVPVDPGSPTFPSLGVTIGKIGTATSNSLLIYESTGSSVIGVSGYLRRFDYQSGAFALVSTVDLPFVTTVGGCSCAEMPGALLDVTGDKINDLVTGDPEFQVWTGDSTGGFATPTDYGAGTGDGLIEPLAIGDLDGDGRDDVAFYNGSSMKIYYQDSSGVFGSPVSYLVNGLISTATIADLDGDGKSDLILSDDENLGVALQQPDKTLGSEIVYPLTLYGLGTFPLNGTQQQMYVADMNGDGVPDLVISNGSSVEIAFGSPLQ